MTTILVDTHALAWSMLGESHLSPGARAGIEAAEQVLVSPVSLYEITQKVRLGKWAAMAPRVDLIEDEIVQNGFAFATLNASICLLAGRAGWPHRDPFDRLIAATALVLALPLVTRDPVFSAVPGLRRIW